MKTAKPPAVEPATGSSRRAQPVRRTRTNPARTTAPSNGTHALGSARPHDQPIEIFPAVTHFADAITALPKELVRHFTLLKEVDAKIFAPEESLFKLIEAALNAPTPDAPRSSNDASSSIAPASAPMSAQNSSTESPSNGHAPALPSNDEAINTALFDASNLPRRQLFRQTAFKIQEMLVSLEEKNHVISTANEALQKQLGRIEDLWPHLENEFTDEAKWGSTTHWAYLENRIAKANNNSQAERSRREGAATLSAAAQQLAEEAAVRSSERKQAMAAKKNSKNNQANDAEADGKPHEQASKKPHNAGKSRKPAGDAATGVGLGISTPSGANGANSAPKRRKVESSKQVNNSGGSGAEKAMSTVFGASAAKPKTTSPSGTPAPEAVKKRKALPTSSNQAKKSRTVAALSPSVTGSPLVGTFPAEISKAARSSPAPSSTARPSSSRARPATIQPVTESGTPHALTSIAPSNRTDDPLVAVPEAPADSNSTRAASEAKVQKDAPAPSRSEPVKVESEPQTVSAAITAPNGARKDSMTRAPVEDSEGKKESGTPVVPPRPQPQLQPPASPAIASTPVMTKSGRASKPSTPSLGTFAEAAAARSRPSRASENPTSQPKRSHKKGASAAAAAAAAAAMAVAAAAREESGSKAADSGAEDDEDGDEPRYCYCNGISYGEMVACDANGCKREWFHLDCVGLKVAPKGNAKWYCEDCKKRLRLGSKTVNGR